MDFDETRLYFSHQQLQRQNDENEAEEEPMDDEDAVDLKAVRRHFREFLRTYNNSFMLDATRVAFFVMHHSYHCDLFVFLQGIIVWVLNATSIEKSCYACTGAWPMLNRFQRETKAVIAMVELTMPAITEPCWKLTWLI